MWAACRHSNAPCWQRSTQCNLHVHSHQAAVPALVKTEKPQGRPQVLLRTIGTSCLCMMWGSATVGPAQEYISWL